MRIEREQRRGDGLRERPFGDLVGELVGEAQAMAREELRLAKAELREEARKAARGGAELGAGGAVLYAALLLFGLTLVFAGATFLPAWLAAAIVTALYGAAGWVLLSRGKEQLRRADPARAIEQVKEDARWARETMRDVRSSADANA